MLCRVCQDELGSVEGKALKATHLKAVTDMEYPVINIWH